MPARMTSNPLPVAPRHAPMGQENEPMSRGRGNRSADRRSGRRAGHRPSHGFAAGRAAAAIDNTLYDNFGQRQTNTMYTQVNQYHVIIKAQPQFASDRINCTRCTSTPTPPPGSPGLALRRLFIFGIGIGWLQCDHHECALHTFLRHPESAFEPNRNIWHLLKQPYKTVTRRLDLDNYFLAGC